MDEKTPQPARYARKHSAQSAAVACQACELLAHLFIPFLMFWILYIMFWSACQGNIRRKKGACGKKKPAKNVMETRILTK
ncbi:MAG TPA: hypothetical protein IAA52_11285 [Candidatus Pullichristensenella stercorigallinarum]|uniref:Uncharacterized protein n=1 Tax=Candidatus Pullichristensenella stercorigallinarum TaxID=2840909 RepID=A0A9D0ZQC3_9FIRM|nr:hypothetical protein [Candidatus Pullichristensenella stercorigallinarum]